MSWLKPVKYTYNGKWYHDHNVAGLQLLAFFVGIVIGVVVGIIFTQG